MKNNVMYEKKMEITKQNNNNKNHQWLTVAVLNFGGVDGPAETKGLVLAYSKKLNDKKKCLQLKDSWVDFSQF